MAFRMISSNADASCAGAGTRSTVPSRAVAMPRSSRTSQSAPTPRQSHWKTPWAVRTASRSDCEDSLWFFPSVRRIACRCVTFGTDENSCVASRSQVPMAVPPPASRCRIARLASSRAPGSIRTMGDIAFEYGKARVAWSVPAMMANHVPSRIWSIAAAAACWALANRSPCIDPDVSRRTISAASPPSPRPASPAPLQVIVTTACTSVPPCGRNSFW
jgi:hypothetical protein